MVRVAFVTILQGGNEILIYCQMPKKNASFTVKIEHMDSKMCCHQNMVLIKANIIHL